MEDTLFESVTEAKEPRDVATREPSIQDMLAAVANQPNAADRVAVLERLMALKEREDKKQAKALFEAAFAKMQSELPAIIPDKEVKARNGEKLYDYASLPYIKKIIDPIVQKKYGFSYYWSQADSPDGKMRTVFHLCNFGHERENFFQSEMLGSTAVINPVQAARGTESYQKRATLIDGVGLTILGEDKDGHLDTTDPELQKTLAEIEGSATTDDLMEASKKAREKYANNPNAITFILGTYAQARKRLTGGGQ
jgi:hypothetical protein